MSIRTQFPSNSFVRVGKRWFRVYGHAADGVTVNTYSEATGKGMAIHATCIDEVSDMGRPRKTVGDEKAKKVTDTLLAAVQYCSPGYKENGESYSLHAAIQDNWITTYNGIVQYGSPIETPLHAYPRFDRLLAALKATTGEGVQITQVSADKLSIKGAKLRTVVPCLNDPHLVARQPPDPPISVVDSRMIDGFNIAREFVTRGGDHIVNAAILIDNGYLVATDLKIIGMFWHGIGFPRVTVPADFVEAVLRIPKSLVNFGYTPGQSLTFYFDDGCYIRTQLYSEDYPDISRAFPTDWEGLAPVPEGFFDALRTIEPFVSKTDRRVYLNDGTISSNDSEEDGTVVKAAGIVRSDYAIDVERMLKLEHHITHVHLAADRTRFAGESFRGAVVNFVPARSGDDEGPAEDVPQTTRQQAPAPQYPPSEDYSQAETNTYAPPAPVSDGDDGAPVDETPQGFTIPAGFA